jgi:hypothetical protein
MLTLDLQERWAAGQKRGLDLALDQRRMSAGRATFVHQEEGRESQGPGDGETHLEWTPWFGEFGSIE